MNHHPIWYGSNKMQIRILSGHTINFIQPALFFVSDCQLHKRKLSWTFHTNKPIRSDSINITEFAFIRYTLLEKDFFVIVKVREPIHHHCYYEEFQL